MSRFSIDGFVLDRVIQPVIDRFRIDPVVWGVFFMAGSLFAFTMLAYTFYAAGWSIWTLTGPVILICSGMRTLLEVADADVQRGHGRRNALRRQLGPSRFAGTAGAAIMLTLSIVTDVSGPMLVLFVLPFVCLATGAAICSCDFPTIPVLSSRRKGVAE